MFEGKVGEIIRRTESAYCAESTSEESLNRGHWVWVGEAGGWANFTLRGAFFWRRTESSRIEELWDRERGYKTTGVKGQEEDKKALKKPLLPFATLAKRIRGEIDDTALFSLGPSPF